MSAGWRLLLFGATGAIGGAVADAALARGWSVTGVTRGDTGIDTGDRAAGIGWRVWNPIEDAAGVAIAGDAPFDGVCWAQGANMADSLADFDAARHLDLYAANVLTVLRSAATLVSAGKLRAGGARLVAISSIWQERARRDKLSYAVTKAALGGFVRAASVDLADGGHLVNAVLPGVIDTPMTRANLTAAQIAAVEARTPHRRLPDLATLAETVLFLCSAENKSVSGQSLAVDLGMSNACLL